MKVATRWIPIVFDCALAAVAESRTVAAAPSSPGVDRVVYESLSPLMAT